MKGIDNLIKVTELLVAGKLESEILISKLERAILPMRIIKGFVTSLDQPEGREKFIKSIDSRVRKAISKNAHDTRGEFIDGKFNDERRFNITIPQEILYSDSQHHQTMLFSKIKQSLKNFSDLELVLDIEATEIVSRSNGYFCFNLVFRESSGKTLEIQVLSTEAQVAKKLDDPLYAEAQNSCNKLIEQMPVVNQPLKPNYFYEIFSSNQNIPSQDILAQLEIESSASNLHLVQKLRNLYLVSTNTFKDIKKPNELYIKKLKALVKSHTAKETSLVQNIQQMRQLTMI
jgi:hypothetical protein